MKWKTVLLLFLTGFLLSDASISGAAETPASGDVPQRETSARLNALLNGLEERYLKSAFSARFFQETPLKELDITDTASGKVYVKPPGMMRWDYETPEKKLIVTDGKTLWIYRPEENQVMVGKAAAFFGEGKGAVFLSDIRALRQRFRIELVAEPEGAENTVHLRLFPREEMMDVSEIDLWVSRPGFEVRRIVTRSRYGDETRISLSDFRFDLKLADDFFRFAVPDGADVVRIGPEP